MQISIHGCLVPVEGAPGVNVELVVASRKFCDWVASLHSSFRVSHITITWAHLFERNGVTSVGFFTLNVEVNQEGASHTSVVFVRGQSVGILIELECEEDIYFLMTEQPRLAVGWDRFIEIAAGMLDESGNFVGIAAREIQEETGFTIGMEDLFPLNLEPIALSPGACDERINFYLYRTRIARAELEALRGKRTGLVEEREQITLRVLTPWEALQTPDAKTLVALLLRGYGMPVEA